MQAKLISNTGITASQIDGVVEAHYSDQDRHPVAGETLLSQYKQCNAINDQQLRGAKNIKDLVNINVATLDKQLFVRSRGQARRGGTARDETSYNLQFDPVNFLQKVPCMGDREFLVNQSILHNSTTTNRVSEAASRQRFMQQQNGGGSNRYQSRGQPPQTTKSAARGLGQLLPQLPTGGFSVKVPRPGVKSNRSVRRANTRSLQAARWEQETVDKSEAPDEPELDLDSVKMTTRSSQADPVRCLRSIFKKHEPRKRNPCVNQIAEKYKHLARSSEGGRGPRTVATANTIEHSPGEAAFGSLTDSFAGARDSIPASAGGVGLKLFQSSVDMTQSLPHYMKPTASTRRGGNHILLQHHGSAGAALAPPATAPLATGRAEAHARGGPGDSFSTALEQESAGGGSVLYDGNVATAGGPEPVDGTASLLAKRQAVPLAARNPALRQVDHGTVRSRQTVSQRSQQTAVRSGYQSHRAPTHAIVSDELTQAQQAIRSKLQAMKNLFEEEDTEIQKERPKQGSHTGLHSPDSSQWDLHNHRLMYEEAMQARQHHLDQMDNSHWEMKGKPRPGSGPVSGTISGEISALSKDTHETNQNLQEEELNHFLTNRIAELQSQNKTPRDEDPNEGKMKFKGSTIQRHLPSKHQITDQLMENYENRTQYKGAQLQQKLLNTQARQHLKKENKRRALEQVIKESHRKEVISARSKGAHSPGGSDPGSPLANSRIRENGSPFSINSRSSHRRQSKQKRRQINTDLAGNPEDNIFSDGLSTQNASVHVGGHNGPATPRGPDAEGSALRIEPHPMEIDEPAGREHHSVQFQQDVQELMQESGMREPPHIMLDGVADGADMEAGLPGTAVVLLAGPDAGVPMAGRRVNYLTQVLRGIDAIDKRIMAEQMRQNQPPDDLEVQYHSVHEVQIGSQSVRPNSHQANCTELQSPLEMSTPSVDSPNALLQDSEQSDGKAPRVSQLLRKSLGHALGLQVDEPGEKPDDVLIVEQEPNTERIIEDNDCVNSAQEYRAGTVDRPDTVSQRELGESRNVARIHSRSLAQSQGSSKSASRINTAEKLASSKEAMSPNSTVLNHKENRGSDAVSVGSPASHSFRVLGQGNQKYSHSKVGTSTRMPTAHMTTRPPKIKVNESSISFGGKKKKADRKSGFQLGKESVPPQVNVTRLENLYNVDPTEEVKSHIAPPKTDLEFVKKDAEKEGEQNFGPGLAPSTVTGSRLSYFCPKRFNRFPRFTIFFKRGQKEAEGSYSHENTVSLNADFLKFLSDRRNIPQQDASGTQGGQKLSPRTSNPQNEAGATKASQLSEEARKAATESEQADPALPKVPSEVEQWNEYLKQRQFDPFDRVVLVKGIDNSILTSFRTLKGENNTVSDTFKIVHRKFQPGKTNGSFYKNQVTHHADKFPYRTLYRVDDLDEEGDDIEGDFEVFQQLSDGTFEQLVVPTGRGSAAHRLDVHPNSDLAADQEEREELSSSKLQHAITAALIDLDADGTARPAGPKTGKVATPEKRAPFKAAALAENPAILPTGGRDVASSDSSAPAARQSRMPRPRPLALQGKQHKSKERGEGQPHSPGRLVLSASFGVNGVSPLTQQANNIQKEQQVKEQIASPQVTVQDTNNPVVNQTQGGQVHVTMRSTVRNSYEYGLAMASQPGADRPSGQVKISPVRLVMQPHFQVNSTATVEALPQEELGGQDEGSGLGGGSATGSLGGAAFLAARGPPARATEALLVVGGSSAACMSNAGTQVANKGTLNPTVTQAPQSSMLKAGPSLGDQHASPGSVSQNRAVVGAGSPEATEYLPGYSARRTWGAHPDFASDADVVPFAGSHRRGLGHGREILTAQKEAEHDSQNEYASSVLPPMPVSNFGNELHPPTVNVITSNVQFVSQLQSVKTSIVPTDGDVTCRQEQDILLDSNGHQAELDNIGGIPIVHRALGGRKLPPKKQLNAEQGVPHWGANWKGTQPGSPRGQIGKGGPATDRAGKKVAAASGHVGVLKIPESLQGWHLGEDHALEEVAQPGARKGAVGSMIDKIYNKDRRMVNSMYKGNMLSTAVLTDMTRYHRLKSSTGVESKDYDELWLQERIEEEQAELGLSLDCAPQPVPAPHPVQQNRIQAHGAPLTPLDAKKGSMGKLRQSLLGASLLLDGPRQPSLADSGQENPHYADLVNRSEHGTALAKPNYH